MKARSVFLVVAALLAASTLTPKLQAQPPINIETVTVGDAGNAADTTGYGAVNYEFNIGKHEVTIGQYSSFLNSAASVTSDSYIVDLWNPNMATDFNTAGISRSGSGTLASPYSYSMIGSRNRPAGGKVFYLDPEDIPARMVARLLALGIDREAIRQRLFYLNDVGPADYAPVHEWAKRLKPEMVILDGLAEALAREGLDENKQADILTFFRNCIRPFADNGSAVVIADHVSQRPPAKPEAWNSVNRSKRFVVTVRRSKRHQL